MHHLSRGGWLSTLLPGPGRRGFCSDAAIIRIDGIRDLCSTATSTRLPVNRYTRLPPVSPSYDLMPALWPAAPSPLRVTGISAFLNERRTGPGPSAPARPAAEPAGHRPHQVGYLLHAERPREAEVEEQGAAPADQHGDKPVDRALVQHGAGGEHDRHREDQPGNRGHVHPGQAPHDRAAVEAADPAEQQLAGQGRAEHTG